MEKIVKEININEKVNTLYNMVFAVYHSYYNEFPENMKKTTTIYLEELKKELEKDYHSRLDIEDNQILNVITFVDQIK